MQKTKDRKGLCNDEVVLIDSLRDQEDMLHLAVFEQNDNGAYSRKKPETDWMKWNII